MNSLRILLVVIITMSLVACGTAMPIGFNLPPLGGSNLGGLAFANVDWNPTSTSVFIDLFKHCSPMYVRKVCMNKDLLLLVFIRFMPISADE